MRSGRRNKPLQTCFWLGITSRPETRGAQRAQLPVWGSRSKSAIQNTTTIRWLTGLKHLGALHVRKKLLLPRYLTRLPQLETASNARALIAPCSQRGRPLRSDQQVTFAWIDNHAPLRRLPLTTESQAADLQRIATVGVLTQTETEALVGRSILTDPRSHPEPT